MIKGFKYFIGSKNNKETRPLCILFPEMNIYKTYSDKTKYINCMIKGEQVFDKYSGKSYQYNKNITSELMCNKKYSTQKKAFNVFIYH